MLILKHEPTNVADRNAVAVFRKDQVVGHVPFNLAQYSLFLKRDVNKAFAKVVGKLTEELDMDLKQHLGVQQFYRCGFSLVTVI